MPVPTYTFGMASGPFSGVGAGSAGLGKAVPIGRDLELDPLTGDLLTATGDLRLVRDILAIRQEAETRMRFFLGEWFLDTTIGVPYFQNVLVKAPNLNAIKTILSNEVLATAGVKSLLKMDLSYDRTRRTLGVAWSADTDLGELVQSVVEFEG